MFWVSLFLFSLAYMNHKLNISQHILFFSLVNLVFCLVSCSLTSEDKLSFREGWREIKSIPSNMKKMWEIAWLSFVASVVCIVAFWFIKKKPELPRMSDILLLGMSFFKLFVLIYFTGVMAYYIKSFIRTKPEQILDGLSAQIIVAGTLFRSFIPITIGLVVVSVAYVIGFTGCCLQAKALSAKKLPNRVSKHSTWWKLAPRLFIVIQSLTILLTITFEFILFGACPGSELYSGTYFVKTLEGINYLAQSAHVFRISEFETDKGLGKGDFLPVIEMHRSDKNINAAIESFNSARTAAKQGLRYTWRHHNIFRVCYWTSDMMLVALDLGGQYLTLFKCLQDNDPVLKTINDVFGKEDVSEDEITATLSLPDIRAGLYEICYEFKKCNDIYSRLWPAWFWRLLKIPFPGLSVSDQLIAGECGFWLWLHYSSLKEEYGEGRVLLYRKEGIQHTHEKNLDELKANGIKLAIIYDFKKKDWTLRQIK